jgi:hypothetical protein
MSGRRQLARVLRLGAATCVGLSAGLCWLFYQRYLRWDFNELGRYYDPQTQLVYTTSGVVWGLLAAMALLAAAGLLALAWHVRAGKAAVLRLR